MSIWSSSEKKGTAAKVHRLTRKYNKEVEFAYYARALDKIYTDLGKTRMIPQVVQKMRRDYPKKPYNFYLRVCKKYGITPEKKFMMDMMIHAICGLTEPHREIEGKMKELSKAMKKSEAKLQLDAERWPDWEQDEREVVIQSPRSAQAVERIYSPRSGVNDIKMSPKASPRGPVWIRTPPKGVNLERMVKIEYVNIYPGDICETMVLTWKDEKSETGFWVRARVTAINNKTKCMELEVLQPKKYGLAKRAVNVPYQYIRAPAQIKWAR